MMLCRSFRQYWQQEAGSYMDFFSVNIQRPFHDQGNREIVKELKNAQDELGRARTEADRITSALTDSLWKS